MKQILILLLLVGVTFACKKKTDENPTVFEGKVIYNDDDNPAAGANLTIASESKSPPLTGSNPGDSKVTTLGEDGSFRIEFPYNESLSFFGFFVSFNNQQGTKIFNKGNGLDCSPYDCEDFKPHQTYSNLVIKVPRP